jgi:hypothetical protein
VEQLNNTINWEHGKIIFLSQYAVEPARGRPLLSPLMLFKCLLLQKFIAIIKKHITIEWSLYTISQILSLTLLKNAHAASIHKD